MGANFRNAQLLSARQVSRALCARRRETFLTRHINWVYQRDFRSPGFRKKVRPRASVVSAMLALSQPASELSVKSIIVTAGAPGRLAFLASFIMALAWR